MTRQEMAAIMMADGPWEMRRKGDDEWYSDPSPSWDWHYHEYRVKPQPKVLWVNEYGESGDRVSGYRSKDEAQRCFCHIANARCAVRYVESPEE